MLSSLPSIGLMTSSMKASSSSRYAARSGGSSKSMSGSEDEVDIIVKPGEAKVRSTSVIGYNGHRGTPASMEEDHMAELEEVTSGLQFPEGPIAMADGTVILVEMFGPTLTRVHPDGKKEVVAEVAGGPNGAAVGPDGALYVANNGARFTKAELGGLIFPGPTTPELYIGGRISKVDVATGHVSDLYTECD